MDREQLKQNLSGFFAECKRRGQPIADYCISDAFPGIQGTSYILEVKAPWVDDADCSDALDFLFEILFQTTEEETRKHIFSIQVLNSKDEWHCSSQPFSFDVDKNSLINITS